MPIRAARLDAQKVFMAIEELADESQLTADHLREITECDLPAGKYRWDGKRFVPLPNEAQRPRDDVPSLEEAFYAFVRALVVNGQQIPPRTAQWANWYRSTVDRG